jgi:2-amino-4-hydroxy-6-hydroxymethyldihydropteridine diphosphokinase
MTRERTAVVALGSNLGDRDAHLAFAVAQLGATPGVTCDAVTASESTVPLGGLNQPAYLNAMVRVRTTLSPEAFLEVCHAVERDAGRERPGKWASRTLDLDVVWMSDAMCDRPDLTLPHPGLRDRPFWARQLAVLEGT